MRDFHELLVWQRAHALTLDVYAAVRAFPDDERYGLVGQLRRASSSVAVNIAEGCGRDSDADFARFLQVAAGSASEVEYELLLAKDLGYLSPERHGELLRQTTEVKRMLHAFMGRLRNRREPRADA